MIVAARRLVAVRRIYGPDRTDGIVVVGTEDGVDLLVSLQDVRRHVEGFLLVEVGRLVGDDLYVGVLFHYSLEAFLPVGGGGGADEPLKVNHVALRFAVPLFEQVYDVIGTPPAGLYAVPLHHASAPGASSARVVLGA